MKKVILTQFMSKLIEELLKEQRNGTAHVYQSTLNRLIVFMDGHEINFNQLTPEWLMRFQKQLVDDQLSWNTISTYMRMLRSIYNQALACGAARYVPCLFNKVYTGVDSRVKRAIKPETMRQIMEKQEVLPANLTFSRDMFVLLFLLRGMSFVDLAFLRRCDIDGNAITYHRHKTGRKLTIVAGKEAMDIIKRHRNTDEQSAFLFPIIKRPGEDEYRQYTNMLRLLNYRLVQVKHTLKLKESLSTYVARHTWATLALRQNFNSRLICDAMGHSSVKVTETYFQSFSEGEVDQMNKKIISFVLSHKQ